MSALRAVALIAAVALSGCASMAAVTPAVGLACGACSMLEAAGVCGVGATAFRAGPPAPVDPPRCPPGYQLFIRNAKGFSQRGEIPQFVCK